MKKACINSIVSVLIVSILVSLLTLSGCSLSPTWYNGEDNGAKIYSNDHDFLEDYESAILDALESGSERDIRDLFAENTLDNNDDIDDGIEYVLGLIDWEDNEIEVIDDNVSSYTEFGGEYEGAEYEQLVKALRVSCKVTVVCGDKTFRIFFGGVGNYSIKIKHSIQYVSDMMGLTYLRVHELDEDGNIIDGNDGSLWLDGVYYPERANIEMIADMILKNEGRTDDGSWVVDTSDEAIEDRIIRFFDENALAEFDESELEGLRLLLSRDNQVKKFQRSYYITDDGAPCLVLFFHYTMGSRCLILRLDGGKITGATLGYEKEYGDLHAEYGDLSGFEELVQ